MSFTGLRGLMPRARGVAGGGEDEFGSEDEVKVYKDEGEEEGCKSFVEGDKRDLMCETEKQESYLNYESSDSISRTRHLDSFRFGYFGAGPLSGSKYGPFLPSALSTDAISEERHLHNRMFGYYPFLGAPYPYFGSHGPTPLAGTLSPITSRLPWWYLYGTDLRYRPPISSSAALAAQFNFPPLAYGTKHPAFGNLPYTLPLPPTPSSNRQNSSSYNHFQRSSLSDSHPPTYSPFPYYPSPFLSPSSLPSPQDSGPFSPLSFGSENFLSSPCGISGVPGISHPKLVAASSSMMTSCDDVTRDSSRLEKESSARIEFECWRERHSMEIPFSPALSRKSETTSKIPPDLFHRGPESVERVDKAETVAWGWGVPQRLDEARRKKVKKPLNAFMLYMKEMRHQVMDESPYKESSAINQILGRKWHSLQRSEQAKYYDMARKEKLAHRKLFPSWSARENYSKLSRNKKIRERLLRQQLGAEQLRYGMSPSGRIMEEDRDVTNIKKCRARYGIEHMNKWCKPCRRKKRCIRFTEGLASSDAKNKNIKNLLVSSGRKTEESYHDMGASVPSNPSLSSKPHPSPLSSTVPADSTSDATALTKRSSYLRGGSFSLSPCMASSTMLNSPETSGVSRRDDSESVCSPGSALSCLRGMAGRDSPPYSPESGLNPGEGLDLCKNSISSSNSRCKGNSRTSFSSSSSSAATVSGTSLASSSLTDCSSNCIDLIKSLSSSSSSLSTSQASTSYPVFSNNTCNRTSSKLLPFSFPFSTSVVSNKYSGHSSIHSEPTKYLPSVPLTSNKYSPSVPPTFTASTLSNTYSPHWPQNLKTSHSSPYSTSNLSAPGNSHTEKYCYNEKDKLRDRNCENTKNYDRLSFYTSRDTNKLNNSLSSRK